MPDSDRTGQRSAGDPLVRIAWASADQRTTFAQQKTQGSEPRVLGAYH